MQFFEVFPTVISKSFYHKNESLKSIIENILKNVETSDVTYYSNSVHYYEKNDSLLEHPELKDFKDFLLDRAKEYLLRVYKTQADIFIPLCWINKANSGHTLVPHNHANAFLSGTYYLNYDHDQHAHLQFYKSDLGKTSPYLELTSKSYDSYNAKNCEFLLAEGDFLIWPSNIEHGYINNSSDNRISISMNFLPKVIDNGRYRFQIEKI